jgi:hypothetical protein
MNRDDDNLSQINSKLWRSKSPNCWKLPPSAWLAPTAKTDMQKHYSLTENSGPQPNAERSGAENTASAYMRPLTRSASNDNLR